MHTPGDAKCSQQMFCDLVQIGVVVRDLEQSVRTLTEVFGLGPFRSITWPPEGRDDIWRTYRGKPASFSARLAFAELGKIELELIQPLAGESIWSDFLREHGEGIHHIRFNVPAVESVTRYLAEHGIEDIQSGQGLRPGTTYVNFGTDRQLGFVIEIMNPVPGTDGRTPMIVDGQVQT